MGTGAEGQAVAFGHHSLMWCVINMSLFDELDHQISHERGG